MQYISTRGNAPILGFADVLTTGLASDGGLYVPKAAPVFSQEEIASWKDYSYTELAYTIIAPYIDGAIPENTLKHIIEESYRDFRDPKVAPLVALPDNAWILELFHGPTLSFKDFALQLLGRLLDYVLAQKKEDIVIIGATSGDTGSAAIEGCRHSRHIQLFMLHPYGRVSDIQRKQMTTVDAPNIHNIAIEGTFDDCQNMVKEIFNHPEYIPDHKLTAVNSINWARIMAQIVYYFSSTLALTEGKSPVSYTVPTGNFGDIFAGFMAKKMGLPIDQLVVATNQNDILDRFFKSNDYSMKGVHATVSPSMDIQISSNFERLLFDLHNQDGEAIRNLMQHFKDLGELHVEEGVLARAQALFDSQSASDVEIKEMIKTLYKDTSYLADPHTAAGLHAADHCRKDKETPMVTLSTAHPAKFPVVAEEVLDITPELPDHLPDLLAQEEHFTRLPNKIEEVKAYITEQL